VVAATKNWVERLSPIWVEGQLIEIKRRSGAVTQFLTMRDTLAEVSVTRPLTAAVEKVLLPAETGFGHLCATVTGLFDFEQSFKHADGGVERRPL
jgi:exodeoxyribonuclease VII large subunit